MFQPFDPAARFREVTLADAVSHFTASLDVGQRFPRLIGLRESAGASFARRRVVVAGVGSVGRRMALHAGRLGVGELWLVDPDRYDDRANLLTQEILASDLGHTKAGSTGKACKEISPATRVYVYEGKIQDLDPVVMARADVVFLATDNLAAEVEVSHLCRLLGITIVQASVHGETLVVQVRFVLNRNACGPCLICSYGPEEYRHLNRSSIFRCSGIRPGGGPSEQTQVMPTRSTSFLCSLAADFALMQWTRHTLALGQPVTDTLLQYCGYTQRLTQSTLIRNVNCKASHAVLQRAGLPKPLAECTSRELAEFAGLEDHSLDNWSLTLGELSYVRSAICGCREYAVDRFMSSGATLSLCAACAQPIAPQPYYTFRPVPGSEMHAQRDRPLKELGGQTAAWAVLQGGNRGVLLCAATCGNSMSDNQQESCHGAYAHLVAARLGRPA